MATPTMPDPFSRPGRDTPTAASHPVEPDRDLEVRVLGVLESHGPREGAALAAYQRLAERSPDPAVRYLTELILEDERRHHRVVGEMVNRVRSLLWEVDLEPNVPEMGNRDDPELRARTKELLAFEREDVKELRRLRKALRQSPRSSLLPLLVDLMIHDTEKHIKILDFVRRHSSRR